MWWVGGSPGDGGSIRPLTPASAQVISRGKCRAWPPARCLLWRLRQLLRLRGCDPTPFPVIPHHFVRHDLLLPPPPVVPFSSRPLAPFYPSPYLPKPSSRRYCLLDQLFSNGTSRAVELIGLGSQGTTMLMAVPDAIKIQPKHTGSCRHESSLKATPL